MKSKLLFGALLGSIALASCTADDDLATSSGKVSPIKFSVAMESGNGVTSLTRAEVTNAFKLNFEKGDLLSLYHGVSSSSTTFTGYQNAIYEGSAADGSAFEFTTKSMVLPGLAIMVYPADTAFVNGGTSAPVIGIDAAQTSKTKELMPYMSEVLTIGSYDSSKGSNVAGYDKNYAIVLKQVASTLSLTTVPSGTEKIDNLGVSPLAVSSVAMSTTAQSFNISVPVKTTTTTPTSATTYPLWTGVSDVDLTSAVSVNALSTTDIKDNYSAVFTLLPTDAASVDASGAKFVIQTNYGSVTLNDTNDKIWGKTATTVTYDKKVSEGIADVLKNTWVANTSGTFKNETVGGLFRRSIKADMSKLDMNDLHIKNAAHLVDALKVYDAIKDVQSANVNFILDGDANGAFVMTPAAAAAYATHLDMTGKTMTFTPCTVVGEVCTKVVFNSTELTEVPANIQFGSSIPVELTGKWKYTNANKNFKNVLSLSVASTASIQLASTIGVKSGSVKPSFINNGSASVLGITYLQDLAMTNNGTITIPADAEFRVKSSLVNEATSLTAFGKILNSGVLATVNGDASNIYINNYGYIKQVASTAKTYITLNQTSAADFSTAFSITNKFGTLELFNKDDNNYSVSNTDNKGFIMITTTAASVTAKEIGVEANYVKITGDCTECYLTSAASARLLYVEIASNKEVVWTTETAAAFDGLIVPVGSKLNIKKVNSLTAKKATFLKGTIYQGGAFTPTNFVGYLGGATTDTNNVIKY